MIKKITLFVLLGAILWLGALFLYVHYIRVLDTNARVRLAEGGAIHSVVVLTGGTERIRAGARLLEDTRAQRLFISGVGAGVRLEQILPDLPKVLRCCVVLGDARDTEGNAREVQVWVEQQGLKSARQVLLVTAHYHLPRAWWLFSERMPDIEWLPYAVEPQGFSLDDWYFQPLGWRLLSIELLKFLVSVLR